MKELKTQIDRVIELMELNTTIVNKTFHATETNGDKIEANTKSMNTYLRWLIAAIIFIAIEKTGTQAIKEFIKTDAIAEVVKP